MKRPRLLRLYGIYCCALAAAAAVAAGTMYILAFTPIAIMIFIVFRDNAPTIHYMILSLLLSIPAIVTFDMILRLGGYKIGFVGLGFCWFAGLATLAWLLPIIALPDVSVVMGIIAYVGLALTFGFLLVLSFLALKKSPAVFVGGNKSEIHE